MHVQDESAFFEDAIEILLKFNPFMPSGLFYLHFLVGSISYKKGVWLVFIIITFCRNF